MRDLAELTPLGFDLNHPESVAWGPDQRIYAGGEGGEIYRSDLGVAACDMYASTGGCILGLALDADANVYACDMNLKRVIRVAPDGSCTDYATGLANDPMRLPNYPVFDADGNLYVSDSGDWGQADGRIWRIGPDGSTEIWDEQAKGFTNGMCLSADGQGLHVAESSPPLIARIEIRDDGTAGPRTVLVELPRTVPDGIALDREGGLLISLYNPNVIYRYTPAGQLDVLFDDWEQLKLMAPTNIAFADSDLRKLVIANLFGRCLYLTDVEVPGLPLHYPKLPAREAVAPP